MKFSAQEEYGLRCLLRLGRLGEGESITLPEIGRAEGLSVPHAAKLMRILRRGGFVRSARGQAGGYTLARPPHQIIVGEALAALGGRLFDPGFCNVHTGTIDVCTNTPDCSIRSLWQAVQMVVDQVLSKTTLADLMRNEQKMATWVSTLVQISTDSIKNAAFPIRLGGSN